ncbi:MAG: capsular polysaccharide biosynthesis protein CapF [Eubacterium sp.]
MKILVTGAKGFIGKNLIAELQNKQTKEQHEKGTSLIEMIFEYDQDTNPELLKTYTKECDFVYHLAGVNRPENNDAFMTGNFGFTSTLLDQLKAQGNKAPIMLASSTQATQNNPYGQSKKAGEELLFNYEKETGSKVLIYRFPNVFGKWCKPNYNSAVATFCHNIARDLPIQVNDPEVLMHLVYIDDVVEELLHALEGHEHREEAETKKAFNDDIINVVKINQKRLQTGKQFCSVPIVQTIKLGEIVTLIKSFKNSRKTLEVPNMKDPFTKKLYATYLSDLPEEAFSYPLKMHVDARGSFTEFIRTPERGQVSINVSKPGITKGNHWHHTKNEKFLVVKGRGLIRFRKIGSDHTIDYHVTGDKLEVVDIPTGYTHNIINEGDEEMVTVMWANEAFDPDKPDTYFLEV